MRLLFKPLSLAFALALSTAASAQETTDPATGLDLGQPAQATQAPQPYVKETFGDWQLRCLPNPEGEEPCQLYQLLMDGEGNQVAEVSFFRLPEGSRAALGANIVAPLETLLTQGLVIGVDEAEPRRFAFTFCNPGGCVARIGFSEEEVAQLKGGGVASMTLVPVGAADAPVILNMSLSGITAGIDALPVPVAPAGASN